MGAWNGAWAGVSLGLAAVSGFGGWALGALEPARSAPIAVASVDEVPVVRTPAARPDVWPLVVRDLASVPEGPLGDAIRRGERLLSHTRDELPDNVGADLNCTSCHLRGGTVAGAGPWVGVTAVYPDYRARSGGVDTIEERVNDCFERSLNGTAIDPDGDDMVSIVSYMTWLSQDVPIGVPVEGRGFAYIANPPEPDPERGAKVYAEKCVACHAEDGAGRTTPDGGYLFPPLWGERSLNVGAGMARLDTAAAYVRWNMPLGQGGTLTDQEAYDVAAWFTTRERPDFARKGEDWPNGGKPRDARY